MRPLLAGADEVGSHKDHPDLCDRCDAALEAGAGMSRLLPREWGLIAAAVALIADQGSKLALLYGFGFRRIWRPGAADPRLAVF